MQDEILNLLKKEKGLPMWILQGELVKLMTEKYKVANKCCVRKALNSLRKFNEIPHLKIIHESQLKKINRPDLIQGYAIRHFTFAYKIK